MNRTEYYEILKARAREIRSQYGFSTFRIRKSDLRGIFKAESITIDLWDAKPKPRKLRGAYFNDEDGVSVMIVKSLPEEPFIYTMAHELKHHFFDQGQKIAACEDRSESNPIEIGAEIFAAELIFPAADFAEWFKKHKIDRGQCTKEHLVHLKRETKTTLSYTSLAKRATFQGLAPKGSLDKVAWKKLEESIYGEPLYKRVLRYRRLKNPQS